jgi:putative flippase GtrA
MIPQLIHRLLKLFYPLVKKIMPYQVYAYLAVGAANTIFNIILFAVCYWLLKSSQWSVAGVTVNMLSVEIATVISFAASVVTGFWLSKNFAFTNSGSGKKETQKQFGKYFLVSLQGQFADYLITKGLIVFLVMDGTVAYILSTIIMLILNYFLQKHFTFRRKKIAG